jgi:hypothetical protein
MTGQTIASPDRKTKVFISYSRKDIDFVDKLEAALGARGYEVVVDREDIEKGEKWWARIKQLITQADAVVFVMSPDSVASRVAGEEVEHSLKFGKRLVPLVWKKVDQAPPGLTERNYVFVDAYERSHMADEAALAKAVDDLERAINLNDILWVREHTKWVARAAEWDVAGRPDGMVLRAGEITAVQSWASHRPATAPEIPAALSDFLDASL